MIYELTFNPNNLDKAENNDEVLIYNMPCDIRKFDLPRDEVWVKKIKKLSHTFTYCKMHKKSCTFQKYIYRKSYRKDTVLWKKIIQKKRKKNYITKKSTSKKDLRTFELRLVAEKFIYSVSYAEKVHVKEVQ